MSNVFPVLGSVNLSGATSIIRKEHDYVQEHQIAGKDGGLVERVGSASTRWEIKGFLRESGADGDYNSLKALLGTTSNLSIPTFGSGYFLAASGTIVFVESFGANWMPGYGYPRYDYSLKLVLVGSSPGKTTPILPPFLIVQTTTISSVAGIPQNASFGSNVTLGNTLIVMVSEQISGAGTPSPTVSDLQLNTWSSSIQQGSAQTAVAIFWAIANQTSADTITVGGAGAGLSMECYLLEVQGLTSSTPTIAKKTNADPCSMTNYETTTGLGKAGLDLSAVQYYDPNTTATIAFTGTIVVRRQNLGMVGSGAGAYSFSACGGAAFGDLCFIEGYWN